MTLPPCPHLPEAPPHMDYRDLRQHPRGRGQAFYCTALMYGQYLWCRGLPARAILAIARGLYAEWEAGSPSPPPFPYAALRWICAESPPDLFLGNPRLSFQHQARRMRGARLDVRRARAWAAWRICAAALPHLPDDPHDPDPPPTDAEIAAALQTFGLPGEAKAWSEALRQRFR